MLTDSYGTLAAMLSNAEALRRFSVKKLLCSVGFLISHDECLPNGSVAKPKRTPRKPIAVAVAPVRASTTVTVQTVIERELYNRMKKYAGAEHISVSAYIRRALYNVVPGGV